VGLARRAAVPAPEPAARQQDPLLAGRHPVRRAARRLGRPRRR
jgi:hypothetical protein